MHRFLSLMALAITLFLGGCAAGIGNVRACYQGSHGMVCAGGQGTTAQPNYGYPQGQPYGYGQQYVQPIYVQPQYQQAIPPPTLFQQQPGYYQPPPMQRTGPCVGYRLIPNVGYVCQGYQWGGIDEDAVKDFGLEVAYADISDPS